jgi:hypothetical protein
MKKSAHTPPTMDNWQPTPTLRKKKIPQLRLKLKLDVALGESLKRIYQPTNVNLC